MAMGLAPCTPPLLYQGHLGVWVAGPGSLDLKEEGAPCSLV